MKSKIKYKEIELAGSSSEKVLNPEGALKMMSPDDFDFSTESLYALFLNPKNSLVKKCEIAKGSHNTVSANASDIFRRALLLGCNQMILVHNHPSGDVAPSDMDLTFTRKIKKGAELLGLNLVDHLIVDQECKEIYSFRRAGLI